MNFSVRFGSVQSKSDKSNYTNGTELIDSLLAGYDKRLRPNYGGAPVNVEVSMYVLSFDSVSDSNMVRIADLFCEFRISFIVGQLFRIGLHNRFLFPSILE